MAEARDALDAIERLRSIAAGAAQKGDVKLNFEARLRMGEIEIRAGDRETGRARLISLRNEATQKAFGRIARLARATLEAP